MLKLFRDQKGFTLVELMIVVVIVGILAAVAIPMYRGSVKKAKASEAVAALGTIRSALRVYYAEHGDYPVRTYNGVLTGADSLGLSDIEATDLTGQYFDEDDYWYKGTTTTFTVRAVGDTLLGSAPKRTEVAGIVRTIDQDGTIGTQ